MLHKICRFILVFAAVSSTLGCMKIKKKGNEPVTQPNQLSFPSGKELKVEPSEDFSGVQFFWPADSEADLRIEITAEKSKFKWTDFSRSSPIWMFRFPNADDIYQIKIFSNSVHSFGLNLNEVPRSEPPALAIVRLASPLKFNLEKDLNLKETLGSYENIPFVLIEELTIPADKKLFIENFSKKLIIKNLFSSNGVIQTFAANQKAVWPAQARDVGAFQLEILNGQGQLKLNLFAEHGADGAAGPSADEKLTGSKGERGTPAAFEKVPSGLCARGLPCDFGEKFKCVKKPGRGERGGKALQGYSGLNGLGGGSVWPHQVLVNSSQVSIESNAIAGIGGQGGAGGQGGSGGAGGEGGDGNKGDLFLFLKLNPDDPKHQAQMRLKVVSEPCAPAEKGERGQDGDTGRQGQPGPNGKILK